MKKQFSPAGIVSITGSKSYQGTGHSKQEAQLDGARKLLKNLNYK